MDLQKLHEITCFGDKVGCGVGVGSGSESVCILHKDVQEIVKNIFISKIDGVLLNRLGLTRPVIDPEVINIIKCESSWYKEAAGRYLHLILFHKVSSSHTTNPEILGFQFQEFLSSKKEFHIHIEKIRLLLYKKLIPAVYLADPKQTAKLYLSYLSSGLDRPGIISSDKIAEISLDVKFKFEILDPSMLDPAMRAIQALGLKDVVANRLPVLISAKKLPWNLEGLLNYYCSQHSNDLTLMINGISLNKASVELSVIFNEINATETSTFVKKLSDGISGKFPKLPSNMVALLGGICMVAGLMATIHSFYSSEKLNNFEIASFASSAIQLAITFSNAIIGAVKPIIDTVGTTAVCLTDFLRPFMSTLRGTSFAFMANSGALLGVLLLPLTILSLLPIFYETYVDFKSGDYRRGAFNTGFCSFMVCSSVVAIFMPWTLFLSLPIIAGMTIAKHKWFKDPLDREYAKLTKIQKRSDVILFKPKDLELPNTRSSETPSPFRILVETNYIDKKKNITQVQLGVGGINVFTIESVNGFSYYIKHNNKYLASGEKQKKFLFFEKHRDLKLQSEPYQWFIVQDLRKLEKERQQQIKDDKNKKKKGVNDGELLLKKINNNNINNEYEKEYTLMSENCRFLGVEVKNKVSKIVLYKDPKLSFQIKQQPEFEIQL